MNNRRAKVHPLSLLKDKLNENSKSFEFAYIRYHNLVFFS